MCISRATLSIPWFTVWASKTQNTAQQLPELPELPEQPAGQRQKEPTVVVRARAEVSVLAVLGCVIVVALLVMVISGYVRLYELTSTHAELTCPADWEIRVSKRMLRPAYFVSRPDSAQT